MRALLVALDRWHRAGVRPPDSGHPRLDDGTLVPLERLSFPTISGVDLPRAVVGTYRLDDGPRLSEGILDVLPPVRGAPYPVLVPQVEGDGNELAGIRLPEVSVPLGANTGWNLRDPAIGAPSQLARLSGAHFPFARTQAQREATGDPRASIEERYPSRAHYMGLVTEAALELVAQGLLLDEDLPDIVERAGAHWDYATSTSR